MSATAGSRTGRVRVLIDEEPGLTELLSAAVADANRAPRSPRSPDTPS
ncbi:hypothetical protein ABZ357_31970 [Streptomyces sp. NPDC005917]